MNNEYVRALKALGRSTDQWGNLLIYLITSKLDVTTNKEWENSLTSGVSDASKFDRVLGTTLSYA